VQLFYLHRVHLRKRLGEDLPTIQELANLAFCCFDASLSHK
jgi:hypothetical protein